MHDFQARFHSAGRRHRGNPSVRLDFRVCPAATDASRSAALRTARQCHARAHYRYPRAASAGLFPRALDQSRHRRRERSGAALTGKALLDYYGIPAGSADAYALAYPDFAALAKSYGKLGGLDRIATVIKSIRAERGDRTLLLDGGDTWQNSYTSLQTKGQDMVDCMALLKPDAMIGHWEFTLGTERVKEIVEQLGFPFLGAECARYRMGRRRVQAVHDVRARWRQDRGDRAGLPLHADRQSALDDPELVVRHSRGRSARQCREGPQGRRAAGGAAVA